MPYRDIKLWPTRKPSGEITWEIELSHNGGKGGPPYPVLKLEKGLDDVEIGAKIMHHNQVGVKFAEDPIWIERMPSCDAKDYKSPQAPGIYEGEITGVTKWNDNQMTFVDHNKGEPMCLAYRLNFIDTQTNKPIFLDPIVDNGGGGGFQPPPPGAGFVDFGSSAFWMLLGAIFVACLAANIVGRLIKIGR